MKSVPIKDLKERLSYWAEQAAKGEVIEVTRYNRPYIRLVTGGKDVEGLHVGKRVGKETFKSSLPLNASGGQWLKFLQEDRDGDE